MYYDIEYRAGVGIHFDIFLYLLLITASMASHKAVTTVNNYCKYY